MLAGALMLAPQAAQARVFISVGFAPPAIPVYEQPLCPGDGYIWTPGYWQYTDDGYEWVDGAWVLAPYTGALWTPGYWGYGGGGYFWNAGYWGQNVGYYGGINYGFGYFGTGFYGGYWNHGAFFYNREYNHFGGGFRGDHFYSQHVGNFDGRPGGNSFARGLSNGNRGGSYNNVGNHEVNGGVRGFIGDTNHGGFGQISGGHAQQPIRIANSSEMRSAYTGNQGTYGFAGNRGGQSNQVSQARPANTFNGGFGSSSNGRNVAPVNNFHPSQGSSNARPSFGGGQQQRSQPAPAPRGNFGGGSFHGGGGGSPHSGGRR